MLLETYLAITGKVRATNPYRISEKGVMTMINTVEDQKDMEIPNSFSHSNKLSSNGFPAPDSTAEEKAH